METKQKKLFFGLEVVAPWPEEWPPGKTIDPSLRHMTVLFLGNCDFSVVQPIVEKISSLSFPVGFSGVLDECLFLPVHFPKAVSYHMHAFQMDPILHLREELIAAFQASHLKSPDLTRKEFLPHVTVARGEFDQKTWKEHFHKLPFMTKNLHLYESLGNSQYKSLWEYEILAPIEEISHTADIAFLIRGRSLCELYQNAMVALSFHFPPLVHFFVESDHPESLDEAITMLNTIIARADMKIGCPFKAVSFHGDVKKRSKDVLEWEMIVDV